MADEACRNCRRPIHWVDGIGWLHGELPRRRLSLLDRLIVVGVPAYVLLMIYWQLAEAQQPGQQYASPYLPCLFCALIVAQPVVLVWLAIDIVRTRLAAPIGAAHRARGRPNVPEPTADPDRPCRHENFALHADVNRLTRSDDDPTVIGYSADIRVWCEDCQEPFRWNGIPAGISPAHPTCSVDETELHAPLRPASADPDFGMGLPGFAISYRPGPGRRRGRR